MIFHPYTEQEVLDMLPLGTICEITDLDDEIIVRLTKQSAC